MMQWTVAEANKRPSCC